MKDSTTTRDYTVGAILVLLILAVAFAVSRFTMAEDRGVLMPTHAEPRTGLNENPPSAPAENARAMAVAQKSTGDGWLAADRAQRIRQLTGRFDPASDPAFVKLDDRYTDADGDYLLRAETASAIARMIDAAKADGVEFRVRSATRNHARQTQIWEAKWRGDRTLSNGVNLGKSPELSDSAKARMILLYSSMPGTSRHHWGTDVDLNAFDNDYFSSGKGLAEHNWLKARASEFGFYQPYTAKSTGRKGYEEERWHWSYKPLSQPLLRAYRAEVSPQEVSDFEGAQVAASVGAIPEYVLGINPDLL